MSRTNFAATAQVDTPYGPLHLDGNSKITCADGTYEQPVANAFSLPHISTCPGSTEACRAGCYVHGLQQHAADTYERYRTNETTIHRALLVFNGYEAAQALAAYLRDSGITRFRWHVSGDVFSLKYARWIRSVCELAPQVRFWIYTRTVAALPTLVGLDNLRVNVSADADNYEQAARAAQLYGLNLCYFQRDGDPDMHADVVFPDYPLRGRDMEHPTQHPFWRRLSTARRRAVCPADFFGQSEQHRCGPCRKCL